MKKIGIITGASSGMGREFVRQLDKCLKHVEEVWVIARRKERLEELKREVTNLSIRVLPLDLCKESDLEYLEGLLQVEQPKVRLLINCAGVGYAGFFEEITREQACNMISINVAALVAVTHIVLPYMSNPSNIIQLASASAFMPQKEFSVYAASKSFVLSFSRALQEEVKDRGVFVTIVCPGPVDTEFLEICNAGRKEKILKKLTKVSPEAVVHQALADTKKGKKYSIYGLPMKVVRLASKLLN